jgi:hypothetical protein
VLQDIGDDDVLYRRIAPGQIDRKRPARVVSVVFRVGGRPPDILSVDLARLCTAEACATRAGRPGFGVAALRSGEIRSLGLVVHHRPEPDNPAHCEISGVTTDLLCRQLAERASMIIPPSPGLA